MKKWVFLQLLNRYLKGTSSRAEKRLLEEYYNRLDEKSKATLSEEEEKNIRQTMLEGIKSGIQGKAKSPYAGRKGIRRWWYAAAAVAMLGVFGWYIFKFTPHSREVAVQNTIRDIAPGSNKAVLTLADGQKINLDSNLANGTLTKQGNMNVVKLNNGILAYNRQPADNNRPATIRYNSIVTPRGGQYQIILPDGSKVWLNAASSIRYPVAFTGNKRQVHISGEAYFEVAPDAARPFFVKLKGMEIKVLGTRFNVKAYGNESSSRVTLLEGAVVVKTSDQTQRLMPGEQASLSESDKLALIKNADIRGITAWTRGQIYMGGAGVKEIMHQISRWYNVDIVYEGPVPTNHFNGMIDRSVRLSDILKVLNNYGIHCRREGRQVIVLSK